MKQQWIIAIRVMLCGVISTAILGRWIDSLPLVPAIILDVGGVAILLYVLEVVARWMRRWRESK
jgi:hypothetical protein